LQTLFYEDDYRSNANVAEAFFLWSKQKARKPLALPSTHDEMMSTLPLSVSDCNLDNNSFQSLFSSLFIDKPFQEGKKAKRRTEKFLPRRKGFTCLALSMPMSELKIFRNIFRSFGGVKAAVENSLEQV
jgi:hypothetical protein